MDTEVSMEEIQYIIEDLDEDFLVDFVEAIELELSSIERYLINLHQNNENNAFILKQILRFVSDVKDTCNQTFLDPLSAYVLVAEDLIREIEKGHIPTSSALSELLLLIFDEVRAASEDLAFRRTLDVALLSEFKEQIKLLISKGGQDINDTATKMISHFARRVNPDLVFNAFENSNVEKNIISVEPTKNISSQDQSISDDLEIFKDLAEALDQRSHYWDGRVNTIVGISLNINNCLPPEKQVDEEQLLAAVYMHDVFMSMIPDTILFKEGKYDSTEIMLLQQHPLQAYQVLTRMKGWEQAAQIVYQHHERYDGNGYPNQKIGPDICMGAKIIAIADTYFSLTHKRSDRDFHKSVLRATSEINKFNGRQFDPYIVEAFNAAMMQLSTSP